MLAPRYSAIFKIAIVLNCLLLFSCGDKTAPKKQAKVEHLTVSSEVKVLLDDTSHINAYVDSIKKKFPELGKDEELLLLGDLSENWRSNSGVFAHEEFVLAEKLNSKSGHADALCKEGIILVRKLKLDSAALKLDEALGYSKENGLKDMEAQALSWKAEMLRQQGQMQACIDMQKQAIALAEEAKDKKRLAFCNLSSGEALRTIGDFDGAALCYEKAITFAKEIGDLSKIANSYNGLGEIYKAQNNYPRSLEYFSKALPLARANNNNAQTAFCLNSMGDIYNAEKDYNKALPLYEEGYKISEINNIKLQMCNSLSGIGMTHFLLSNKKEAIDALTKTIELATEIGNNNKLAFAYLTLGSTYESIGESENALKNYYESISISAQQQDNISLARSCNQLGLYLIKLKKLDEAEKNVLKALWISKEFYIPEEIKKSSKALSMIYEAKGSYQNSLKMFHLFNDMKDTINSEESIKKIAAVEMQAKEEGFKLEQKAKEATFRAEQAQKEEELKTQKTIRYAFTIGFSLVLVLVIVVYKNLRENQRKNKIITEQKKEVEHQKELVEEKAKEITDSINYAKRLQDAILPPIKMVGSVFPESFILYLPKDIVAGDFYWMEKNGDLVFFAAADSTGHGVPGSIVSVVCSNALNRAVKEFKLDKPGTILDKTRELVLETFEKSEGDVKDGMDVSLFCFDTSNKKVSWAGANNPLWYRSGEAFNEIKANKQPIGKTDNPLPFTTHEITYEPGTIFYLLTDGFADQFGGPKGKKFKYKQLELALNEYSNLPMKEQHDKLEKDFNEWKGSREQVDDVTIIAVKL